MIRKAPASLHQQNPPVLNWRCRQTQADLYSGRKTVVVIAVASNLTFYTFFPVPNALWMNDWYVSSMDLPRFVDKHAAC